MRRAEKPLEKSRAHTMRSRTDEKMPPVSLYPLGRRRSMIFLAAGGAPLVAGPPATAAAKPQEAGRLAGLPLVACATLPGEDAKQCHPRRRIPSACHAFVRVGMLWGSGARRHAHEDESMPRTWMREYPGARGAAEGMRPAMRGPLLAQRNFALPGGRGRESGARRQEGTIPWRASTGEAGDYRRSGRGLTSPGRCGSGGGFCRRGSGRTG